MHLNYDRLTKMGLKYYQNVSIIYGYKFRLDHIPFGAGQNSVMGQNHHSLFYGIEWTENALFYIAHGIGTMLCAFCSGAHTLTGTRGCTHTCTANVSVYGG